MHKIKKYTNIVSLIQESKTYHQSDKYRTLSAYWCVFDFNNDIAVFLNDNFERISEYYKGFFDESDKIHREEFLSGYKNIKNEINKIYIGTQTISADDKNDNLMDIERFEQLIKEDSPIFDDFEKYLDILINKSYSYLNEDGLSFKAKMKYHYSSFTYSHKHISPDLYQLRIPNYKHKITFLEKTYNLFF